MATRVLAAERRRWTAAGVRRLALWLVVETAAIVFVHQLVQLVMLLRDGAPGSDFLTFYATSRMVLDGRGAQLYDLGLQRAAQTAVAAGWTSQQFLPFANPPMVALLVAPLALLPWAAAHAAWSLLLTATAGAGIVSLTREAGFRRANAALACLVMAAFAPVAVAVLQGQPDSLILAGLGLGLVAWRRGRDGLAGALFGLGLLKPHLLFFLPLILLGARSWRGLAGFTLTAASMVAVPTLAFGWPVWRQLAALDLPGLVGRRGTWSEDFGTSFNLAGLLEVLPAPVRLGLLLAVAAGLASYFLRGRLERGDDLALAVAASVALAPHAFTHDLALLLVPGAWVAGWLLAPGSGPASGAPPGAMAWWRSALLLGVGLALPWLAITILVSDRPPAQWSTVAVLATVMAVVRWRRAPRRTVFAA